MFRFLILFILAGASVAFAQEHNGSSRLQSLLAEVRERNPEIRAAWQRWQAAQARIKPAGTLANPQIGLGIMMTPYPLKNAFDHERAITLSQMFEFPGKLGAMSGMAGREADMAAAEYERVILALQTEVKKTYWMLYQLDFELDINRENRELMQQFVRIAEIKYATGTGMRPDVLKAQTELAMLQNDSLMLAQERASMAAMLNALLDRPREQAVPKIQESVQPAIGGLGLDSLVTLAYAQRPELHDMQAQIEMYRLSGRLARLQYYPDLMLSFTHRRMPEMLTWDAMVGFSVPLFFWRKENLRVKEASANQQMAIAGLASMRNMIRAEVERTFYRLQQASRSAGIFAHAIVPQAEQSLAATRAAYENNEVDFLMLLDSQRMLRDTKVGWHRALADFGARLAELELAVGVEHLQR